MRSAATIIGLLAYSAFPALSTETILIPNGSFESPTTTYASPFMDSWQKNPKPDWYDEGGGAFLWTQLTGEFTNTPPGAFNHIDNMDGGQAAWMFVIPEVAIFQDYDYPTNHAFNAIYEVRKAYHLTVGIIGTGGNMQIGATFELALYYRDSASNLVVVAATDVTNVPTVFSNNTHFIDFRADSAFVQGTDPWAGQHIGVRLLSTITDTNLEGGYWDLDNVRLTSTSAPTLSNPVWTDGQLSFMVQSEPGAALEIQKSPSLDLAQIWSSLGSITNDTGTAPFTDADATNGQAYYRARLLP
jgi:hypothetical protein